MIKDAAKTVKHHLFSLSCHYHAIKLLSLYQAVRFIPRYDQNSFNRTEVYMYVYINIKKCLRLY